MSKITCHSEVGKIKSLVVKRPRDGFIHQEKVDQEWERLNYLKRPDFETSTLEFEYLEDLIDQVKPKFHYLPDNPHVTIDSIYCRDASLPTDFGVIICRMGKDARKNEPEEERKLFELTGLPILGQIEPPGTMEGGDCLWLDEHTLAIGHTYRTNMEAITQVKSWLEPKGIEVIVAEMPHYKGHNDVFHLMSVISPVDHKKAVVYSPLMPIHFRNELLQRGFELIEVPDDEFDSMGSNVLAISPGVCIVIKGNPITKKRLMASGCKVLEYSGKEISLKGCGGPTCLTRPIQREV